MLNYGEKNAVLLNCVPIFLINYLKKQLPCLYYILADLAVTRLNEIQYYMSCTLFYESPYKSVVGGKSGDCCLKKLN